MPSARSATEGYGAGWEARGRRRPAELAALLALLFPFTTATTLEGSASVLTLLGRLKRGGWKVATGGVAALVVVAGGATYATGRPHETSTMLQPTARPALQPPSANPPRRPTPPAPQARTHEPPLPLPDLTHQPSPTSSPPSPALAVPPPRPPRRPSLASATVPPCLR